MTVTRSDQARAVRFGTVSTAAAERCGEHRIGLAPLPVADRLEQLAGVTLFEDLTPEELRPLAEAAVCVTFQPGERLVRQGEPGESVFIIIDGRVEVLTRTQQDEIATEAVVAWLIAGDTVGELSLLDGEPRSASCVALSRVTCLRLDRAAFLGALDSNVAFTRRLLTVFARRLRLADKLMAEHARDPLTGLNNRRALAQHYEREALRAQRAARQGSTALQPLGLLFADVNDFKQINDTFGHQVGDGVLRALATTLIQASRATDLVARYGGDEFVVLLPDAGAAGVKQVATRIRHLLRERPASPVPFTVSIGWALVDPLTPQALDTLLANADAAMYRDKAQRTPPP